MPIEDQLFEVFDRGLRDGIESLTPADRELFLIQDFIIVYEMGGLSGYFYNKLPEIDRITEAVAAMSYRGLRELAELLREAAKLFDGHIDSDTRATWGDVLRHYDPTRRLDELDRRIGALDNYGLNRTSNTKSLFE
jgi:hypothetical protein